MESLIAGLRLFGAQVSGDNHTGQPLVNRPLLSLDGTEVTSDTTDVQSREKLIDLRLLGTQGQAAFRASSSSRTLTG